VVWLFGPKHPTNQNTLVNESRSLILGPTDEEALAQFILRIAFSNPSDKANPVLQGVFALASLQLYGSLKSFRFKHLVISSVKQSIYQLDEKTLLQNLIATMLLYHYEVAHPVCVSLLLSANDHSSHSSRTPKGVGSYTYAP
jgi:hypothetical protein